ncbi:MAG: hypothetical protein EOP64_00095 [Sphingomonas sp.]|nr:MAG: hypothetical protein EOP64_00095 [Sphingomonas sp.]
MHASQYVLRDNPQTLSVGYSIMNSEMLSEIARRSCDYQAFRYTLRTIGIIETAEGVAYNDSALDVAALDRLIAEMKV